MRALLRRLLRLGRSNADAAALLGDLEEEYRERLQSGHGSLRARVSYAYEVIAAAGRGIGERLIGRAQVAADDVTRRHDRMRRPARLSTLSEQLLGEFVVAWRRIRAAPGPTVFAVITLALGIGVTVATYSVVYTALWRPLGIADEDRLVLLARSNSVQARSSQISRSDYDALLREPSSFAGLAAWAPFTSVLAAPGTAELISGETVTGSYFETLGVEASIGRMLGPDDDHEGATPRVVLAYRTWRDQFSADPAIVGRPVKIGSRPFEVAGVAPAGFRGVNPDGFAVRAAWVPAAFSTPLGARSFRVAVRLRLDQTAQQAAQELTAIGQRLDVAAPLPPLRVGQSAPVPASRYWTAVATDEDLTVHTEDAVGRLIVGLPGLVLLIACTNLANLVLSRGTVRRQEFGVRRALGAPRWRLIREQLVEQAVIAIVGGAGGVLVAHGLVRVAERATRDALAPLVHGLQLDWSLDAGVLTATGVAVLLAILVAGVLPALHLTRDSLRSVMDQGGAGATPRWRGRGNLIAVQVGVSVGLFLVAVVFIRLLMDNPVLNQARGNVADERNEAAVAFVPFATQQRDRAQASEAAAGILSELGRAPDVAVAAATSDLSFSRTRGNYFRVTAAPADGPAGSDRGVMEFMTATPDIFAALKSPMRAGRPFNDDDRASAAGVAIVNEGFARVLFGTADVVGRQMRVTVGDPTAATDRTTVSTRTIVGTLPDTEVVSGSGRRTSVSMLYVPLAQQSASNLFIVARARDGQQAPVDTLRAAIKRVDPELAVAYVSGADVLSQGPLAFLVQIAMALTTLALVALGLSMTGLYGVLAHVVLRRTREMGIRMALGAGRRRLVALVLKDGFRPIVEGLFIGLATATVIRVYLKSTLRLDAIAPLDPLAFVAAGLLVAAAGALACYLPARRAASVDPNVALRNL